MIKEAMKNQTDIIGTTLEKRIDEELASFRAEMMTKSREELYELAYRIYMTERIGVVLKEMLPTLQEEELQDLAKMPSLTKSFYDAWTQYEDNSEATLTTFLHETIAEKIVEMRKK